MEPALIKSIEEYKISDEVFDRTRDKAEEAYKKVGQVVCPYFNKEVKLNVKGLDHLKSKSWGKTRSRGDQYMRFKFLGLVPEILRRSSTLQGYHSTESMVRKKNYGSWQEVLNKVHFYEFIYVHREKTRVKVIVRKDGEGELYFYSIIPFWKMGNNLKKIITDGNAEED